MVVLTLGVLFLRRYRQAAHHHDHAHEEHHHHDHSVPHAWPLITIRNQPKIVDEATLGLGVGGGIVHARRHWWCFWAVSLQRIGFGLLLIVALASPAAVLIAIGMLMVYAQTFAARFRNPR
jgi:hypothetical protein